MMSAMFLHRKSRKRVIAAGGSRNTNTTVMYECRGGIVIKSDLSHNDMREALDAEYRYARQVMNLNPSNARRMAIGGFVVDNRVTTYNNMCCPNHPKGSV